MRRKILKPIKTKFTLSLVAGLFCLFLSGCSKETPVTNYVPENYLQQSTLIDFSIETLNHIPDNPNPTLSVPTYLTKIKDMYFIVDCYHNQVIYNENLTAPLYEWRVMTQDLSLPHTIASDGTVYMIDDTEQNRILIMEESVNLNGQPVYIPTQEFTGIGDRPHYVIYHEETDTFYAWSSESGEMFLFRRPKDDSRMYLTEVRSIPSLAGIYVRSFTIIDDNIYFVSGNSTIIEAKLSTFEIKKEYPVPNELTGMVQLTPIEDYYYITISTDITGNQDYATIIRTKDLDNLIKGEYEDVYDNFVGGGTPYYITGIDDTWYLTEHRLPGHSIWSFKVTDNQITDVQTLY